MPYAAAVLPKAQIDRQLARLRKICGLLPEAAVEPVGQHHSLLVRGKKFGYHLVDHHGDDRVSVQCKAEPGLNATLVAADAARFFLPPYMARHGWIGIWTDVGTVDWDELEAFLTDAYRLTAPKRLAAQV